MALPVDPAAAQMPAPAGVESYAERSVSEQDKRLAADWLKRIQAAQDRPCTKEAISTFERNRSLLKGRDPDSDDKGKMRSNLFFAELARMRPAVYAKDPEYSVRPTRGVPQAKLEAARKFGETAEVVLDEILVKGAKLKRRAKRLLTAVFTTRVGWWKLSWQDGDKRQDPLIVNRIKDTSDNLERLQAQRAALTDPQAGGDVDLKIARLRETLAGLQAQAEVVVARGLVLDFVLTEDVLILDPSVLELTDYERASAMAHRVWFTRDQYKARFGYDAKKGKGYVERDGKMQAGGAMVDRGSELLCVWEVWDQDSNRVFHVCEGEEGFCQEPFSPTWTGERWYPFFALSFNDVEDFWPLSDVELIEPLVREYNENRDDFVQDRRDSRPVNIVRKGGSLTDDDVKRLRNRNGADIIMVEGIGGRPIGDDVYIGSLARIDPATYDTSPARSDIEQILGGGDAARGSVLKAKTATEAEILSQGLRGRSAERQDTMEDLLSEVGKYALEICLRQLSPAEVQQIAGEEASWPTLTADEVFRQVVVDVRGGSTGKPDKLQDQDRWTKLLPVIKETIQQVSELRANGQTELAQALIELTRETLRRFDERLDLEQFLPPAAEEGQPDPVRMAQEAGALKAKAKEMADEIAKLSEQQEKAYISAAAQIATSADPMGAAAAFVQALAALSQMQNMEKTPEPGPDDGGISEDPMNGPQDFSNQQPPP